MVFDSDREERGGGGTNSSTLTILRARYNNGSKRSFLHLVLI